METLLELIQQKNYLNDKTKILSQYARLTLKEYSYAAYPLKAYRDLVDEPSRELDQVLLRIFEKQDGGQEPATRFRPENVFVWGGPTPLWGGSMEPDASVRGAEYFGFDNVVYVYGAINEEAMELHRNCKRLICQVSATSRTQGAQNETDEECAEKLSRLSLKYPNIQGGIVDDLIASFGHRYSLSDVKKLQNALKKHNPALELSVVIYARELDNPNLMAIAAEIDVVNLWLANKAELAEFDLHLEKCRARFPGKKIMLGIFMQDIGLSDLGYDTDVIKKYLDKARTAYSRGKIQDVVILGDREVAKFPELARTIRDYFHAEFMG